MRQLLGLIVALLLAGVVTLPDQAAAANKRNFVYLSDDGIQIFGFELGPAGTLTELGDSPFATGVNVDYGCEEECQSLAYAPGRALLFAGTNDGIVVFKVGTDGNLTKINGSPFGETRIVAVSVVERGPNLFVYGSARDDNTVVGFRVNGNSTLTELEDSPFDLDGSPDGLATTDKLLFVVDDDNDTIYSFKIQDNGKLTKSPGSPVDIGGEGGELETLLQNGRILVYAADEDEHELWGFKSDQGGRLTRLPGSPFAAGIDTDTLALGGGQLQFAINANTPFVKAFKVDGQGRPIGRGGSQDTGIALLHNGRLTSDGRTLVLSGQVDDDFCCTAPFDGLLRTYSVDKESGTLRQLSSFSLKNEVESELSGIIVVRR